MLLKIVLTKLSTNRLHPGFSPFDLPAANESRRTLGRIGYPCWRDATARNHALHQDIHR